MDPNRFSMFKTGELIRVPLPRGSDWAFVPDNLPREMDVSQELLSLLGDARERLGTLNGIGRTLINPTLLLQPLQQREAITSSSLEGTDVHPMELLQYQLNPKGRSEGEKKNAWREVSNYNTALLTGYRLLTDKDQPLPLSSRLIRAMHHELMTGVRGADKRPGDFRNTQVHIGSDRRFVPPPPNDIPRLVGDLEEFMNEDNSSINPLIRAYMAHYQFEAIHPFRDGNGRIGRVLLALSIYLWNGHGLPWLYMSAFFDRYKDEYINNLFRVSTHGDWESWLTVCLRGTVEQCDDSIDRCERLAHLRDEYHAKADTLSPRMRMIVDGLFDRPVFRIRDLMDLCKSTRPTAQKDANELVECGIAHLLEDAYPRTYFIPSIIDIAFDDVPVVGDQQDVAAP